MSSNKDHTKNRGTHANSNQGGENKMNEKLSRHDLNELSQILDVVSYATRCAFRWIYPVADLISKKIIGRDRLSSPEGHSIPTMGIYPTYGGRAEIGVHPGFLNSLTIGEAICVLTHEYLHFICQHFCTAYRNMDPLKRNMAADLAVNCMIRGFPEYGSKVGQYVSAIKQDCTIEFPDGVLLPETFGFPKNLSMLEYYDLINKNQNKPQIKQILEAYSDLLGAPCDGTCGSGGSSGGQSGSKQSGDGQSGDKQSGDGQSGDKQSGDKQSGGKQSGDGQSDGNGGVDGRWKKFKDKGIIDTHGDPKDQDEWDLTRGTANNVAQKLKAIGDTPGGLTEMLDQIAKEHSIDWRKALMHTICSVLSPVRRNTTTRYSRRYGRGFPGTINELVPNICIAVDTSCSMSKHQLEQIGAMLDDICAISTELHIVHLDAAVQAIDKYNKGDGLSYAQGRGGTMFAPYFASDNSIIKDADIHIIFTDGGIGDIDELQHPYPAQVIWIIAEEGDRDFHPPFGYVIPMIEHRI